MTYQNGEDVYVLESGREDAQLGAWAYIQNRRAGVVRGILPATEDRPDQDMIVVEFPEPFPGGHHCNHLAANGQGQYFTAKNLRPLYVQTVPNIDIQDRPDKDAVC